MKYVLNNGVLTVSVESLGAEPVSVIYGGKERLWQNENGAWTGHAPVLFPVCGHFGVRVNGKDYPIGAHGFAKKKEFSLHARGEDFIELRLTDDEETRAAYPFEFAFTVRYSLSGSALVVSYTVENTGGTPLAFSCGGHPSFALDGDVGNYCLEFAHPQRLVHLPHDGGGYLTGERVDFGTKKLFALPPEYLQNGNTLIFGEISSREAVLKRRSGEPLAKLNFSDYPNLLLWRPHGADMICIEPWYNLPDPARGNETEFLHKHGTILLSPEQSRTLSFTVTYY